MESLILRNISFYHPPYHLIVCLYVMFNNQQKKKEHNRNINCMENKIINRNRKRRLKKGVISEYVEK